MAANKSGRHLLVELMPNVGLASPSVTPALSEAGKDGEDNFKTLMERWLAENPAGCTQQTLVMQRVA